MSSIRCHEPLTRDKINIFVANGYRRGNLKLPLGMQG